MIVEAAERVDLGEVNAGEEVQEGGGFGPFRSPGDARGGGFSLAGKKWVEPPAGPPGGVALAPAKATPAPLSAGASPPSTLRS